MLVIYRDRFRGRGWVESVTNICRCVVKEIDEKGVLQLALGVEN